MEITTRPYSGAADQDAVLDLLRVCRAASRERCSPNVAQLRVSLLGSPPLDPTRNARLWEDAAGQVCGFAMIWRPRNLLVFYVHPEASGGAVELLSVTQGVRDLAPTGSLNRLARAVGEFLGNRRRFGVLLTVRPEQLAVRETFETAALLRGRLAIDYIKVVLNGVPKPLFSAAECVKIRPAAHRRLARQRWVRDGVHIHDLNATLLRCLGIEHTRLTYRYQGRDFRLTDVHGNVVHGILA